MKTNNSDRTTAINQRTRPDTRPTVADGWAGAEMRVSTLSNSIITDGWTNGQTDKASYGVACAQLQNDQMTKERSNEERMIKQRNNDQTKRMIKRRKKIKQRKNDRTKKV